MSKTFTSRPTVTHGSRGRGRGTTNRVQGNARNTIRPGQLTSRMDPMQREGDEQSQEPQTSTQQTVDQRMTYMGGFSMIPPNQRKRQEVTEMARREMEAYEQHKQQNRQQSFNYVGTIGGGETSLAEAREKVARETPTKAQRLLKDQQRKLEMRRREDEELNKKKEEQRRKAEMSEKKAQEYEKLQEEKWNGRMKKTNEAWLNRLERQAAKKTSGTTSSGLSGTTSSGLPGTTSSGLSGTRSSGLSGTTSSGLSGTRLSGLSGTTSSVLSGTTSTTEASDRDFRWAPSTSQSDDMTEAGAVAGNNTLILGQQIKLKQLQDMCPHIPKESLLEILRQTDFDVEEAIRLLVE